MSEQAKIAALQEKIRESRNQARTMSVLSLFAIIAAIVGFYLYFLFSYGGWGGLLMAIAGAITFPLFSIGEWRAHKTKRELISELERMSVETSTCFKCSRQIPQGSFTYCPFCGAALETQ